MKNVIASFLLSLSFSLCYCQQEMSKEQETKINETIINYLKFYKSATDPSSKILKKPSYSIIKNVTVNKELKKQIIDKVGVEKYLNYYRKSGYLSEDYLNSLRVYFYEINKNLVKSSPIKHKEIIKINGLDIDIQLQTFEPEEILDNLETAKITKNLIIYNKALVGIHFKENVDMIFLLTKIENKWLIDYIGADNTNKYSLFSQ